MSKIKFSKSNSIVYCGKSAVTPITSFYSLPFKILFPTTHLTPTYFVQILSTCQEQKYFGKDLTFVFFWHEYGHTVAFPIYYFLL